MYINIFIRSFNSFLCFVLLSVYTLAHNTPISTRQSKSNLCPDSVPCSNLSPDCFQCAFPYCLYGEKINVTCKINKGVSCDGIKTFNKTAFCNYCFQEKIHICTTEVNCDVAASPRQTYIANCTIPNDVICKGQRRFYKKRYCNWSSGYKWSTAVILSITLGGFGVDRFYLGLWRAGIGKLFSFGGLGVWTLVDVILISTGFVKPADGSFYI